MVGSSAPRRQEQGNILGLSENKHTLPLGQVLPFYNLTLEKIKVLATTSLVQKESLLLYLEIESFFALFGFINNQFQLLSTFQQNLLNEDPNAPLVLTLNATSATGGDIYKLQIGTWEAFLTVTPQEVNLIKIL